MYIYICLISFLNSNAASVLQLEALDPRSCHVALPLMPRCHNGEHIPVKLVYYFFVFSFFTMLRVDGLKSHCVIRYNFKNPCPHRHTCMQAWVHVHFKHFCLVCFSKKSNSLKQVSGRDFCWGFSRNRLSRGQRISRGCLRLQGSHFRIQGLLMQWKLLTSEGLSGKLHI